MAGFTYPSFWFYAIASGFSFALGIVYIIQAPRMAADFKLVLIAHRRILVMALVCQGMFLCFIGTILIAVCFVSPDTHTNRVFSFICAGLLLILSVWTGSTGARSDYLLLRISYLVTIAAAGFLLLGNAQG